MTLTYALVADSGIVLAADSQVTDYHKIGEDAGPMRVVGAYKSKTSKIRQLKNGSAFSIAGNAGIVDSLLATADAELDDSGPFEDVVRAHENLFRDEYEKAYGKDNYPVRCAFLFCGFTKHHYPQIIQLDSSTGFTWNPVATTKGYGFTGRENHGGVLYLHRRLFVREMKLDAAKCLAYCVLSEVADLDEVVGPPIEMAVITESGVAPITDFSRYERKRQQVIGAAQSIIHSE